MKSAIVTGASRGIGLACVTQLLEEDWNVIGIARDFSNTNIVDNRFTPITIDLSDLSKLEGNLKQHEILAQTQALICCAGQGRFGSLEEFSSQQINDLITLNLTSQIILCRYMIPVLTQHPRSDIVLMGSESALHGARYGAVYSASKFGLRGFAQSLRYEAAAKGLKICLINPGMVKTGFFDPLGFTHGDNANNYIEPIDVAECIFDVLRARNETIIDEINLSPLQNVVKKKSKVPE